jgi:hypothetical protein
MQGVKMGYRTAFPSVLIAVMAMLSCSHPTVVNSGGSTTTDNARVRGTALYANGTPAAGAVVRVRLVEYVRPIGAEPDSITRHDTTVDDSGRYSIDDLEIGTYRIEVNDNASSAMLLTCEIVTEKDSVELPTDTLAAYQSVAGKVDATLIGKGRLYIQVFGLDRIAPVDSFTGAYAIPDMPTGVYRLRVISTDTSFTPVIIDTAKTDTTGVSPVVGQWRTAHGPYAGTVKCIAIGPAGEVYAGTDGAGVFLTTNSGGTWTGSTTGLTNNFIQCLALSPDARTLYAGTRQGIFQSTDQGITWQAVYAGIPSLAQDVRALVACPNATGGADLYAGTRYNGIFKSVNKGIGWSGIAVGNGLWDTTFVTSLAAVANPAGGSIVFAGTSADGVFRSADNGASWTKVNNGLTDLAIECLAVSPDSTVVYAGNTDGANSTMDNGATWKALPVPNIMTHINAFAAFSGGTGSLTLYAGDYYGGLYSSADSGATWTTVASGLTNTYVNALAARGATIFAGVDFDGMFSSINSGASWVLANNGLANVNVTSFASSTYSNATFYAGTNHGVFSTTDNTDSWEAINTGLTNILIRAVAVSANSRGGDNLFAAPGSGAFLSTDNGANWSAINTGWTNISINAFAVMGTTVFAGADNGGSTLDHGVFTTINNGATWTAANTGFPDKDGIAITTFVESPNGTGGSYIFAGTSGGGIFRSTDNGAGWTAVNTGLNSQAMSHIHALAVCSLQTGLTELIAGTENGLFLSVNNGASWTPANNGLGTSPLVMALAVSPDSKGGPNLFAGMGGGPLFNGVWYSVNNGASWTAIKTGLPNAVVNALIVNSNYLYAAIDKCGVWKIELK